MAETHEQAAVAKMNGSNDKTKAGDAKKKKQKEIKRQELTPWVYDTMLATFNVALDVFFREIYPRNSFRVPKKGPVIIVAAPHNNQFADSIILMRLVKQHVGRRTSFLVAEKSLREPYIGALASRMGSLPVTRAMDHVKPGQGFVYLPDPENDPTLLMGVGTDFTSDLFMPGGSLIMPKVSKTAPETQYIDEILGPNELRLRQPYKTEDAIKILSGESTKPDGSKVKGTKFKIAPHIDQNQMFNAVYEELSGGSCIGIFPEGGSHDRSDLLPLKAGAAIMALGALARDPGCGLSIIPCGMNYFNAHKFRSRAVMEFGAPIEVHPDQVKAYAAGGTDRRNAIGSLLETIYQGLETVTQLAPDHETLQMVQATRRLYNPIGRKLPLPVVVEFNRRLLKSYTQYRDDPRVQQLRKAVLDYNRHLRVMHLSDHQVTWGNYSERSWSFTFFTLLYRLGELLILSIGTLPGILMFWPVFVTSKVISIKKQRKALAGSVVKLQGHDVVATWKILVAMGLAPALYTWYSATVTFWLYYNRVGGYYTGSFPWYLRANSFVPDLVPLWQFYLLFFAVMVSVSFAALRIGEIGMDILKSLPPLFIALNPMSSASLGSLRNRREALADQVRDVINGLGPDVFPSFDEDTADEHTDDKYVSQMKPSALGEQLEKERDKSRGRGPAWWPLSRSSSFSALPVETVERRGREKQRKEKLEEDELTGNSY